jgi:deoxyribonuclease (pyrimidine dimer)
MTRINLVDPAVLTNAHLMAEYRELPRIFTAVAKDPIRAQAIQKPQHYCLGKGHVIFFYDKLHWLIKRYNSLYHTLIARNYALDHALFDKIFRDAIDLMAYNKRLANNYQPRPEDVYLNMARLAKRSNIKSVTDEIDAP